VHVGATALKVEKGRVKARKTVRIGHKASLMDSVTNITQRTVKPSTKCV